ncbi:MAG: hypothetical protein GY856_43900 [bacterium]|nr:hypothetical protein [bacterium]
MVQVDLPAAFAIGQIYALLSKDYLKKDERKFTNRLLGPFNFFMSCCFAPVGMFLLIGWPAWEIMYWGGWVEDPFNKPWVAGFYVLFGIVMVVLGNVGFILAHHWYRKGRDQWVVWGSVVGVVLTLLPFVLQWGVWMNVGNYAEVDGGAGYSFFGMPFFGGWLVVMGYMGITAVGMGLWLKKKGNLIEP